MSASGPEGPPFDDAIVGAGILGLAHAYHLARRGRRVIVFERHPHAVGASVRNFGMLWPIGQPLGTLRETALRSRALWLEVLAAAGLWHNCCGSLHLAYREDEAQVLREFATQEQADRSMDNRVALFSPAQAIALSPALVPEGLQTALWSPTEVCVDPREVIARLPAYLEQRFGVRFVFGVAVTGYSRPHVLAGGREWRAENLYVCSGDDLTTLYPETLAASGLYPCKLQMLRTSPYTDGWQAGPMLAGGLTLRHYAAFRTCPTLRALRERVAREMPFYDRYGIHVMVSQNGQGEVVLGDSHEYGDDAFSPFRSEEIDTLILDYLRTFFRPHALSIAARWSGVYVKHSERPWFVARPTPGVTIVTGVGGAGMTLSFGLAEQTVAKSLEGSTR